MHKTYIWLCGRVLIIISAILLIFCSTATANPVSTENVEAQLVSEVSAVQPNKPFWVALRMKIREGWHTYWRNPGESGMATTIDWSLPKGFKASDIHWPYPEAIPALGDLTNYGYHDEVYLLVRITPPDELPNTDPVTFQAHAKWLVCEAICIPENAQLKLTLPVTDNAAPMDNQWAVAFSKTRQALPEPSPWDVSFRTKSHHLMLQIAVTGLEPEEVADLRFFPFVDGIIAYNAPQTLHIHENGLTLSIPQAYPEDNTPLEQVQGIIVLQGRFDSGPVNRAFRIDAVPAVAGIGVPELPTSARTETESMALGQVILFAFLGGIILNLMPCVFPVLSMKALNFIDKCQKDPWQVRRHGIVFTMGVLSCFAIVAGTLIALRLSGAQVGWGFQLQSPVFVTLLAYLLFAVGLSLSGAFTLGNSLMGVGSDLASRSGYLGSFATGALTTVVATPCTAPFMGAALGYALTQPWHVGLLVFQALGFGLAFPYLMLSFFPNLFSLLPKPGPWMARVKELLAFPMYATAAWLMWVLALQTGPDGILAALAGMILIAFAGWLFQSTRTVASKGRATGSIGAIAVLVIALGLVRLAAFENEHTLALPAAPDQTKQQLTWEPFSSERLAELRAEGRPVFVNFTAAWCITCLANERVALRSPRLAAGFAEKGIAYLKGDWTNRDPEITQVLNSFGRSGVPLYVYYPPGAHEPIILPQILTETIVAQKLNLPIDFQVMGGEMTF